jgi:hypothetical protein
MICRPHRERYITSDRPLLNALRNRSACSCRLHPYSTLRTLPCLLPETRGPSSTHRRLGQPPQTPYFSTFAGDEHHQVCPPLGLPFMLCEAVCPNLSVIRRYALSLVFPSCCAKPCAQTLAYHLYSDLNLIQVYMHV